MNSTENRQILAEYSEVTEQQQFVYLRKSLLQLWNQSFIGDLISMKAYQAFLDAADCNEPVVSDRMAEILFEAGLVHRDYEQNKMIFDERKLELWNKFGTLGDGMRPEFKNL